MEYRYWVSHTPSRSATLHTGYTLEMLGSCSDLHGSQRHPPRFRYFYPDRGNFIAFVSNFGSRAMLKQAVAAFQVDSEFPVERVAMEELLVKN